MSTYKFHLANEDSLVLVDCEIEEDTYTLAIDTGASHTVIDLTALLIVGFELADSVRSVQFSTANGIVDAYVFVIKELRALGLTRRNFEICAYDFLSHDATSDFEGVLGLDFFKEIDLLISFKRFEISVT